MHDAQAAYAALHSQSDEDEDEDAPTWGGSARQPAHNPYQRQDSPLPAPSVRFAPPGWSGKAVHGIADFDDDDDDDQLDGSPGGWNQNRHPAADFCEDGVCHTWDPYSGPRDVAAEDLEDECAFV